MVRPDIYGREIMWEARQRRGAKADSPAAVSGLGTSWRRETADKWGQAVSEPSEGEEAGRIQAWALAWVVLRRERGRKRKQAAAGLRGEEGKEERVGRGRERGAGLWARLREERIFHFVNPFLFCFENQIQL